jgi:hypothetical protein
MNRDDIPGDDRFKEYIGDAVYVGCDHARQIWLCTMREEGHVERIALEPETYVALQRYVERLTIIFAEEHRRATEGAPLL